MEGILTAKKGSRHAHIHPTPHKDTTPSLPSLSLLKKTFAKTVGYSMLTETVCVHHVYWSNRLKTSSFSCQTELYFLPIFELRRLFLRFLFFLIFLSFLIFSILVLDCFAFPDTTEGLSAGIRIMDGKSELSWS